MKINNNIIILSILLFTIILGVYSLYNFNSIQENYISPPTLSNKNDSDRYLYPIKGLQKICAKEGLKPSYMPKACYIDGKLNSYANCKCEDKNGECKICYPTIQKDSKNSSVIYVPNWS